MAGGLEDPEWRAAGRELRSLGTQSARWVRADRWPDWKREPRPNRGHEPAHSDKTIAAVKALWRKVDDGSEVAQEVDGSYSPSNLAAQPGLGGRWRSEFRRINAPAVQECQIRLKLRR